MRKMVTILPSTSALGSRRFFISVQPSSPWSSYSSPEYCNNPCPVGCFPIASFFLCSGKCALHLVISGTRISQNPFPGIYFILSGFSIIAHRRNDTTRGVVRGVPAYNVERTKNLIFKKNKPILLHYYVTNRCNARCTFCSIWRQQPKVDAKPDNVCLNLKQAKQLGCSFVDFTGGEPLLNKQLPQFLREAKRYGFFTSITTNCILFPQRAQELDGLVDLLHFSIDASTATMHDKIRGVQSFKHVFESIPVALRHNLVPDLLYTYTDENIDDFEGLYSFARKNKLMILLDPVFDTETNNCNAVAPETHKKALQYARYPGVYLNRAHLRLRSSGGNIRTNPLCRAVSSTIVILPDNHLALPCFHHQFTTIPIENNLIGAIKSKKRERIRDAEGTFDCCEGCHINCYFDPSFLYSINRFYFQSISAKFSYTWTKYLGYHWPYPRRKR